MVPVVRREAKGKPVRDEGNAMKKRTRRDFSALFPIPAIHWKILWKAPPLYRRKTNTVAAVTEREASRNPKPPSTISLALIPIPLTRLPRTEATIRKKGVHSRLFLVTTAPTRIVATITMNTRTSSLIFPHQ